MARIEAAGLVHTTPGRSTVVSTIEDKAVLEAQAVAAAMHALAVRIAVPLMDKGQIASELTTLAICTSQPPHGSSSP
jgi:DNA-binding GntR family transcriptional regulator